MKTKSLEELTDKYIGPIGSIKREAFEKELRLDILGSQIRQIRKDRNLTQEQLGDLIGVKKAQISKIENSLRQARFDTILKVFDALNAKLFFRVEVD
jgi:DNA-binding XRE family transcriptional regulator